MRSRRLFVLAVVVAPSAMGAFVTHCGPFSCSITSTELSATTSRVSRARDLMESLLVDQKCFSTDAGASAFVSACADDVVLEDRFRKEPIVGKLNVADQLQNQISKRQKRGGEVRLDKISDGDKACGYTWTWTTGEKEGLRGTSYVELNDVGKIAYMSEFPEPLFKPGDLTKELLKAVTKGSEWPEFRQIVEKTPNKASDIAKYLYIDLQLAERKAGTDELERFWDDNVYYHDLNYKQPFRGPQQVRKLVEDFTFPGIEFRPIRMDDGVDSTCFIWDVVLANSPDSIQGITFLEVDPETRKITYVRDLPESAFKPPILGRLARFLRPGIGVFRSTPLGSRPGGM